MGLQQAWVELDSIIIIFVASPVRDFVFVVFFFFLKSFSSFFVLKLSYYDYCNINFVNLGLVSPGLGWEGASKAGKNPKRPKPLREVT